ncbi:hypothetical protein AMECASPLE_037133 [Ameca splendens]|uniref:Uncharacterized protein n=1 Tax=Ameca splendens TaxID=208324 RepID=A0ABV0XL10_9TELE
MDIECSGSKRKRTISIVISTKFKGMGCGSAHGMGNWHICESTTNAERYIQVFEQHMLPFKQCPFIFFKPCPVQQSSAQNCRLSAKKKPNRFTFTVKSKSKSV